MSEESYSPEQVAEITSFVDVATPSVGSAAHFIFGTNQAAPAELVADRYRGGLVSLIIVTGGVNRHNGVVEGQEFRRLLVEKGVDPADIRCEDESANTQQNVELALPYLREALAGGLPITAVCKWYHRRAVHYLRMFMPELESLHVITFDPVYAGVPVTRTNWIDHPDGRRRVLREWQEVSRRVADGSLPELRRVGGIWR